MVIHASEYNSRSFRGELSCQVEVAQNYFSLALDVSFSAEPLSGIKKAKFLIAARDGESTRRERWLKLSESAFIF